MAASEAAIQVLSGLNSALSFKFNLKNRGFRCVQFYSGLTDRFSRYAFHRGRRWNSVSCCNCQRAESVGGLTADDHGRHASFPVNGGLSNAKIVGDFESDRRFKDSSNSVEDEAWDLLRQSIVYYCGNPVGTIAANDPNDSTTLNYDQVFIRDFIPSGIAFLLKGEYDIVRNFILHTLQLQVLSLISHCVFSISFS